MTPAKKSTPSEKKNITTIGGDVVDSVIVTGDNNQTIIQKFFNIFKSDSETLEHRNRRILLGHVENAWIKGVLDASLHGAALLDLGIKQDPEAVTKYPWAIKKESTDKLLPTGTSMLEIFDSLGMGRSLLILGAPGSGKTTMLLELARGLIARAREDVIQPIPMVFNLSSWTESKTIADWLAQELNNLYSVPRKTAPDWIKVDKLLLLLDGLDEVRQESRAKCVEAINAFRKEHGLTSLVVCSRSQDYADLNAKLSFEGAIEVQPLTQKQITEFFNCFGDEMAGIKQALEKDSALREMAETPLFLSIMLMAYRDKRDVEILVSRDEKTRRKHLFDTYIQHMFEYPRAKNADFEKHDVRRWLSWLASKMIDHNQIPYMVENMQPEWISKNQVFNKRIGKLISMAIVGLGVGLFMGVISGPYMGFLFGVGYALLSRKMFWSPLGLEDEFGKVNFVDALTWNWIAGIEGLIAGLFSGYIFGFIVWLWINLLSWLFRHAVFTLKNILSFGIYIGMFFSLWLGIIIGMARGLKAKPISLTAYPGQRIYSSLRTSFLILLSSELICILLGGVIGWFANKLISGLGVGLFFGLLIGLHIGLIYGGGLAIFQHFTLRIFITFNKYLPFRIVPFLDHCVDLIFLRRVGGGYIFVHRLLMEHFAEMYVETPTSKGN